MLLTLSNNWWLFALRGFFALLLGLTALLLVGMSRVYVLNVLAFHYPGAPVRNPGGGSGPLHRFGGLLGR